MTRISDKPLAFQALQQRRRERDRTEELRRPIQPFDLAARVREKFESWGLDPLTGADLPQGWSINNPAASKNVWPDITGPL